MKPYYNIDTGKRKRKVRTMRKIIDGKTYDTDKATFIGTHESGQAGDFEWYEEALYRNRRGHYFLYGEGGARTRYARRDGDGWTGGEMIVPMGVDEAREWAERYLDADAYETAFGAAGDGRVQLQTSVSERAYNRLREMAVREGVSISDAAARVIDGIPQHTRRKRADEIVRDWGEDRYREWYALDRVRLCEDGWEIDRVMVGDLDSVSRMSAEVGAAKYETDPYGMPGVPGDHGHDSFIAITVLREDVAFASFSGLAENGGFELVEGTVYADGHGMTMEEFEEEAVSGGVPAEVIGGRWYVTV